MEDISYNIGNDNKMQEGCIKINNNKQAEDKKPLFF